jgi:hypothetical protein
MHEVSRTPRIIPSVKLNTALPLDALTKLNAHLYSELEGKVPFGSHQRFFVERINAFFADKHLDLAPYVTGAESGSLVVSGSPEVIAILERLLHHV